MLAIRAAHAFDGKQFLSGGATVLVTVIGSLAFSQVKWVCPMGSRRWTTTGLRFLGCSKNPAPVTSLSLIVTSLGVSQPTAQ